MNQLHAIAFIIVSLAYTSAALTAQSETAQWSADFHAYAPAYPSVPGTPQLSNAALPAACAQASRQCPSKFQLYGVSYPDTPIVSTVCYCPDAPATIKQVADLLGTAPPGIRGLYAGMLFVTGGNCGWDTNQKTGFILMGGACASIVTTNIIVKESFKAGDRNEQWSSSAAWATARSKDTCVPTAAGITDPREAFQSIGELYVYRLGFKKLPDGYTMDCMQNQLAYLSSQPGLSPPEILTGQRLQMQQSTLPAQRTAQNQSAPSDNVIQEPEGVQITSLSSLTTAVSSSMKVGVKSSSANSRSSIAILPSQSSSSDIASTAASYKANTSTSGSNDSKLPLIIGLSLAPLFLFAILAWIRLKKKSVKLSEQSPGLDWHTRAAQTVYAATEYDEKTSKPAKESPLTVSEQLPSFQIAYTNPAQSGQGSWLSSYEKRPYETENSVSSFAPVSSFVDQLREPRRALPTYEARSTKSSSVDFHSMTVASGYV